MKCTICQESEAKYLFPLIDENMCEKCMYDYNSEKSLFHHKGLLKGYPKSPVRGKAGDALLKGSDPCLSTRKKSKPKKTDIDFNPPRKDVPISQKNRSNAILGGSQ